MTPTEQDKELRQKVQDIFNDCTSGWLITIKNFNGYERELGDMESEIIGDILDLITADRKRVELEARREATEMFKYLYENQVSDTTAMYAALAGSEKLFKEGVHVTLEDGSRPVIFAEGVNLSLPEFFYTQLAEIDAELKAQQEEV